MSNRFHTTPFDDGTKIKLTLFKYYLWEWLPVFIRDSGNYYKRINIFDFFAGPGQDIEGEKGSPIITYDALNYYYPIIIKNNFDVGLYFNEKSKKKLAKLKNLLIANKFDKKPVRLVLSSLEFQTAFDKYYPLMERGLTANFLFLDQFGIKQISQFVFEKILSLKTTDFIFFISSSTIKRFAEHPEIKKYINIPKHKISASEYIHIHRVIFDYYKKLIPNKKDYYLASFSIKKGSNVYGLIFGSGHVLGIDKFLNKCWKIDPERGEANFDIDRDMIPKNQLSLFPEMNKPKKLKLFEKELESKIKKKELVSNKDIYCYTLQNGFTSKHCRDVITQMMEDKKIPKQRINISYDSCFKKKRIQNLVLDIKK